MPEPARETGAPSRPSGRMAPMLVALIVGQIGLHSAMAGTRMAAPLQALKQGYGAWVVGVMMALFAATPVLLALHAGRLADRHGYHKPLKLAAAFSICGGTLALLSNWAGGALHLLLVFAAASLCGGGANIGMIAIQRTAGRSARDATERVRIFSWMGLAPALANVVGPVTAGFLIDRVGFWAAYLFLLTLPLVSLAAARFVPKEAPVATPNVGKGTAWDLWRMPGLRRLMIVNWLLSSCWDVHSFAVPILGHERGFSASTIGLVLGVFPLSVTAVRLVVPALAGRLSEAQVLRGAMLGTGLVFGIYPMVHSAWLMAACAMALGLTLGAVQPMVMSTLHHLTPHDRHGEAIALRSMTLNFSSTVMPLLFGAAGTAVGISAVFWVVAGAVGSGSWLTRGLQRRMRAA